ncbi:MAG: alpha-hydroxy-acid oxidizing protein [Leptospiraceae bacterium]|nr:alpha-hydroxy-acid oxidizing protein [Leptospiraceae bacterium]
MRQLLVLGGGFMQLPLIQKTRQLGYAPVVFDGDPRAPGFEIAELAVHCDIIDAESCARRALQLQQEGQLRDIAGAVTAGTDMSQAVACVARSLGLPGIDPADALAATNKVLMRKRLAKHGIKQPRFVPLWKFSELHHAMDELGLPLVLKPARNMGSRGVILIQKREEVYDAWRHSTAFSGSGEMILEEYIPGDELSVDALAWRDQDGQQHFRITGIADRLIGGLPWFVESGHNMPSSQPAAILAKAEQAMIAAMEALGITQGAGKGDLRITSDGQIAIGEVAARLSGGFMSSHTYPEHSGVDLLGAVIQIACGQSPQNLEPTRSMVAIERALIAPAGRIESLGGQAEMQATEHITNVFLMKKPGDICYELHNNIGKLGHVIACAPDLATAEAAVGRANAHLRFVCDPSFGVDWSDVAQKARQRFGAHICHVCKICDGTNCASGIPGMGGVGRMRGFQDNSKALAEIKIRPGYIHKLDSASPAWTFLGQDLSAPIMTAPMTGVQTNMGGSLSDYELSRELLLACKAQQSIAWLGDGASADRYLEILQAVRECHAPAVLICKPRADLGAIRERFAAAAEAGILALGIDIDAIALKTLVARQGRSSALDLDDLSALRQATDKPFVLKGIVSVQDAEAACQIGADAIIVSNHGGRVLDEVPGSARLLPDIAAAVGDRITVLADGGVRSGEDTFKMLALGAKGILFGRMAAIAAVGGGHRAVQSLLRQYREELQQTMLLCGCAQVSDIKNKYLFNTLKDPGKN